MNVVNVCSKIFDSGVGGLVIVKISVGRVPKSRQIVACKAVKKLAETCRVRKNAGSFYQNGYFKRLRLQKKRFKVSADIIKIIGQRNDGHIFRLRVTGNIHQSSCLVGTVVR